MVSEEELYSRPETWVAWSVNWSAVWVGALASLAAALVFGLLAVALGATSAEKFASWHAVSIVEGGATILAAFFSFVIGGWAAAKVTGVRHAEPAILHAAIAWLVATPMLVVMLALGAGNAFGTWYGGLITSPFAAAVPLAPAVVRNSAMASLTCLLVALIGSTLGGWMGSGEPMTFTHYRKRNAYLASLKGKV